MLRTLCRRTRKADRCKCSTQNICHFDYKFVFPLDYAIGRPVARNSPPNQPTFFLSLRMLHHRVTRWNALTSSDHDTASVPAAEIALNLNDREWSSKRWARQCSVQQTSHSLDTNLGLRHAKFCIQGKAVYLNRVTNRSKYFRTIS